MNILLIVFSLLFFLVILKLPKVKGWFGEKTVSCLLQSLTSDYKVINDVMIYNERGTTTQIDHIVVSQFGIFVIETKNYDGWITGNEYADTWTKNVYGNKYQFRNPIKQNYGHIKSLSYKLNLPIDYFISIIVFSTKADLKVKTNSNVIYTTWLKPKILSYTQQKIKQCYIEEIMIEIRNLNVNSSENRELHVGSVQKEVARYKTLIASGICPRCGGDLIVRYGKYGEFLGCSNYPKCRYTGNK